MREFDWLDLSNFKCRQGSQLLFLRNLGKLYESVGLKQQSSVLVLDPETGTTLKNIPMEGHLFGEGLTYYKGKLIQLTYKAKTGFVYDVQHLDDEPETFKFETTTLVK